ncbi:pyridoxine/pyridoxal/pyridoxamine kinase [Rhodanobacter denitrificans]|uniref:pyridoxine/pyridoxal/pyridoxamine kinase n=1 Tax=Rhodanobacter denitrificans TaxID=666685 RepID=UPI001F3B9A17|nr:pyridoxine/pyridoxal/pyridoxamine kinase [Rhodanobacter denitrificans]UJJ60238.1 pyridoxine/pyridoxal/pyridoxamine kinase [Rhodanobacter denitrificans]
MTTNPTASEHSLSIEVVSIMSQVVYGSVGNSIAVPLLQRHGLAVAAVPTVVFSNTPHYPTLHGGAIPVDWFAGYLDDLLARDALLQLRAVVVGFLGNRAQMDALLCWWNRLRSERPDVILIVDPVMGDHDHGVYVDEDLVSAYREAMAAQATGLTPNGFELAKLTGLPVDGIGEVAKAARTLLGEQTRWVVVTSAAPMTCSADEMTIVAVTREGEYVFSHPRLPLSPKGTGDLFTASLTAQLVAAAPLETAVTRAFQDVLGVLRATRAARCAELVLPRFPSMELADR